jgi:hypothetical protein
MTVVEAMPPTKCYLVKGTAAVPIMASLYWWYTNVFQYDKVF